MPKPTVVAPFPARTFEAGVEADGDDLLVTVPDEVLDALGCVRGGTVTWRVMPDGTASMAGPGAAP